MPKNVALKSILVIGSGPIVIGQAAEFDYSGTQGCLALKEEGYRVILVNNNPATIMTDEVNADAVYFEPLTVQSVEKIIMKERPDGLLATLGGQTGLNLAFELHEKRILQKYGVKMLGTPIESIKKGEDREAFRQLMHDLSEPVPESQIVTTVDQAVAFANEIGFPIIIRPAYTLGGSGGGIAKDMERFISLVEGGLEESPITQCLIEKSVAGFKEIEYEVMRDYTDTCITICNMENVDPVGIHTGDSIVVAPSQTLTDVEYQMLRSASIKIISALGIIGGCNIQFALDPESKKYYLIEVNPRVSRSSALASKATGYPIARIAAKLAVGYTLSELINPVTGDTYTSFEPALDYVVVKFPRLPFDKFPNAERVLGTQMKATGEVMAIDRNLERAFQKAINSLESENTGILLNELVKEHTNALQDLILAGDDRRFFAIIELLRRDEDINNIHSLTNINLFFLQSFHYLVLLEKEITKTTINDIDAKFMQLVKEKGFSDEYIASIWNEDVLVVREKRKALGIVPSYKMVDTCAAEFHSSTAYFYSSYFGECELEPSSKPKVLIIGSGPIRIGQGIEFDYSSVHSVFSLQEEGYETILINNNPETVSTDYEIADRLYFEPLTLEDVLNVIDAEKVEKVIVQFGGQTAINLVRGLEKAGVEILGTSEDIIDQLEDRDRFYTLLEEIDVPHVPGMIAYNEPELTQKANQIGFPILLRPSYVIGGKGMIVFNNETELLRFIEADNRMVYPILIDAYLRDKEVEIDLVSDGKDILIPTIVEHIEKAGVHSGDSYAILPAVTVTATEKEKITQYAEKIASKLSFKGIMNIQFVISKGEVYVLEVNPRASRTVPVVSKVTNVPLIKLATKLLLGKYLSNCYETSGLMEDVPFFAIKFPVFSTNKLAGVDPQVGPEMKSTGEGISIANSVDESLVKVFHSYVSKKKFANEIYVEFDERINDCLKNDICQQIEKAKLNVVIEQDFRNWSNRKEALAVISLKQNEQGKKHRMLALSHRIQVFTEIETLYAFLQGLKESDFSVCSIQDWHDSTKTNQEVVII